MSTARTVPARPGGPGTSVAIGRTAEATGADLVAADAGRGGEHLEVVRQVAQ